jgi:hypothetical protein
MKELRLEVQVGSVRFVVSGRASDGSYGSRTSYDIWIGDELVTSTEDLDDVKGLRKALGSLVTFFED